MLLKDRLNNILMNLDMNFMDKGKYILKKERILKDERMMNYNNLFFKTGDTDDFNTGDF